jgi:hypothetical protein
MSGNTSGADFFSDGHYFARMLPEFPIITKCIGCTTIFWLDETNEIGSYYWGEKINMEWEEAFVAEFMSLDDYFRALELRLPRTIEEEIYIRKRIWWEMNDRIRFKDELPAYENENQLWSDNINKLISLLNGSDDSEKIILAELLRNLGNFEACQKTLDSIANPEYDWLKIAMTKACKTKNKKVFQLKK